MKWAVSMAALYVVTLAFIVVVGFASAATRPSIRPADQPPHTANAVSHDAYELHKMLAHTP